MKRMALLLSALALLVCICMPAQAAQTDDIPYVCDTVPLLTDGEWAALEARAEEISRQYQCAVYFITVADYTDYGDGGVYQAAKDIYRENGLGWGQERSGVLLLLSMAERDYSLIAYGYGNTAFTDYGKDSVADAFLDDFADDDWAEGCEDYLDACARLLAMARDGKPYDRGVQARSGGAFLLSLALAFPIALLICWVWRVMAKKEVSEKQEARGYLKEGGVTITNRRDLYTHTTRTRRKIEKSGSSGGTTVGSDGFSGKSGKF